MGESKIRSRVLHREILCDSIYVDSIHADHSQSSRNKAIRRFETGKSWILIATDLISRGIDISRVKSVVNFDFPASPIEYIHCWKNRTLWLRWFCDYFLYR